MEIDIVGLDEDEARIARALINEGFVSGDEDEDEYDDDDEEDEDEDDVGFDDEDDEDDEDDVGFDDDEEGAQAQLPAVYRQVGARVPQVLSADERAR